MMHTPFYERATCVLLRYVTTTYTSGVETFVGGRIHVIWTCCLLFLFCSRSISFFWSWVVVVRDGCGLASWWAVVLAIYYILAGFHTGWPVGWLAIGLRSSW
ncbi:hypothetical protein DENSPDRAFT_494162 [Dentipellis sp. KUC8613]|nr:hypothetical protein DENSPDRAFT_494162 [Dentipellis sp. KUC8613]